MKTEPDTAPGPYYISAIDGPKHAFVSGPYKTHAQALAELDVCREKTIQVDPKTHFAAFGTCRVKADCTKPGFLQTHNLHEIIDPEPDYDGVKPHNHKLLARMDRA